MPAAYAHYRFGAQCLDALPKEYGDICRKYRNLFDIGVHGPDICFYYEALHATQVNRWGSELHHKTGKAFFTDCLSPYRDGDNKDEMLAYLLGFLAHFALDSHCHGYINSMPEIIELSHNFIESQYEVHLMKQDRVDPMQKDRSDLVQPDEEAAKVIARFFPFTEEQMLKAMMGQKRILHLFWSPTEKKKSILRFLIRMLHIPGGFDDLFLDMTEHEKCRETNREIDELYAAAARAYPEMAGELIGYLQNGSDLSRCFLFDFEGEEQV